MKTVVDQEKKKKKNQSISATGSILLGR